MLILQGVTYHHPSRDLVFADIDLTINRQDKIALLGNNGAGKSTLLKIMAGELHPSSGLVKAASSPYYVPQLFGQFNDLTVAQALQIGDKLQALREILQGIITDANIELLADDWSLEERTKEALAHWQLDELDLTEKMGNLSGGQKTRVFLAGLIIHRPEIVLLDEPSNHLDNAGRSILYDYISSTNSTLIVVSHDRTLLHLLDIVCELGKYRINIYGGNYDLYLEQKKTEADALDQGLRSQEKALRKAKETERKSLERKQKLDARGKKKQENSGLPTISMNTFKNNAEKSSARIKHVHAGKVNNISQELDQLREELPAANKVKINLDNSALHKGKILVVATGINFNYREHALWKQSLNFEIISGQRIALKGLNGSGKTTLIKMILGELQPSTGTIERTTIKAIYIDQDYSLIGNTLTVYQQAEQFNSGVLQEHEIKIRLNRFLFTKAHWDRPCAALSGGEKMRLTLCCLTINNQAPDMILLDEPTNNLDMQNIEILTAAINDYKGTLLVVSHDEYFLSQIEVKDSIAIE